MARLLVRDAATREFEIHESALPFWQARVEVIERIPDIGDEPAQAEPADPAPVESGGNPKPTRKAASRPAQDQEEAQ